MRIWLLFEATEFWSGLLWNIFVEIGNCYNYINNKWIIIMILIMKKKYGEIWKCMIEQLDLIWRIEEDFSKEVIFKLRYKGFERGREGKEGSLQLWEKCTTQLTQCLSTPAHQCADPLHLRVISWSPSPASRRGDLNSHTEVGRFGILSMPDRRVIPLHWWGGRLSPGEGETGWVTVARFRQWTCCWLRNGLWQQPCFSPAALSESGFRAAALTSTCKS